MGYSYNPTLSIVPWPADIRPKAQTLKLVTNTLRLTSPLSNTTQTQEFPGSRWTLEASFPPLDKRQVKRLRAFIAKLRGAQGLFYWVASQYDEDEPVPQPLVDAGGGVLLMGPDVVSEGPRLDVAVAQGGELVTRGWGSYPGDKLLDAGDYISYDDYRGFRRLHVVTADVFSDNGGLAYLPVEPPVRTEAPIYARVHAYNASGVFRLVSDDQCRITELPDGSSEVTLSAVEAVSPSIFTAGDTPPDLPSVPEPVPGLGWHASIGNAAGIPKATNQGSSRDQFDQFAYWCSVINTPPVGDYSWTLTWLPTTEEGAGFAPRIVDNRGRSIGIAFPVGATRAGTLRVRALLDGAPIPGQLMLKLGSGSMARVTWEPDLFIPTA